VLIYPDKAGFADPPELVSARLEQRVEPRGLTAHALIMPLNRIALALTLTVTDEVLRMRDLDR